MRSALRRMRFGVLLGLGTAAFLSVVAGLIFLFGGPRPDDFDTAYWQLLVLYGSGGVIAGSIAGLLAPAARHWAGAMLVGCIAAVPLGTLAHITMYGMAQWTRDDVEVILVWSIAVGSLVGLGMWLEIRRNPFRGMPRD